MTDIDLEVKVTGDYYIKKQRGGKFCFGNEEIKCPDKFFVSDKIIDWLTNNIGTEIDDWIAGATSEYVIVFFNKEEDAVAFKLMWS